MTRNCPVGLGLLAAIALLGVHCSTGGAGAVPEPSGDAAPDGAVKTSDGGGCPVEPPTQGTSCGLPDGTDCSSRYPQLGCMCCGFTSYVCRAGKWSVLTSPTDPNCGRTVFDAGSDAVTDAPVDAPEG